MQYIVKFKNYSDDILEFKCILTDQILVGIAWATANIFGFSQQSHLLIYNAFLDEENDEYDILRNIKPQPRTLIYNIDKNVFNSDDWLDELKKLNINVGESANSYYICLNNNLVEVNIRELKGIITVLYWIYGDDYNKYIDTIFAMDYILYPVININGKCPNDIDIKFELEDDTLLYIVENYPKILELWPLTDETYVKALLYGYDLNELYDIIRITDIKRIFDEYWEYLKPIIEEYMVVNTAGIIKTYI